MEASLDWLPRANWRIQANVSLFDIKARDVAPGVSPDEFVGATPYHQISLRSSLDIAPQLQWDVWLRHTGKVKGGSTPLDDVSAFTSLDMRLAWKAQRDLEIALVGQNLLNSSHKEFVSTHILSVPIKIERGVYLKADWKF
jgi:iron complex outermembrane receptor protein